MPIASLDQVPAIASLLDVVCRATGMGLALVACITDDHWTACAVRDEIEAKIAPGDRLPVEVTPCFEVKERERPLLIEDVRTDPIHSCNPVLVGGRFRSYIAAPIILADGTLFGTLCALSRQPARVDTPEIATLFRLFAGLVADQLNTVGRSAASATDLRDIEYRLDISETSRHDAEAQLAVSAASLHAINTLLAASDAALLDAQATAKLREQFVAILGHDLRNPLSSLISGARMLRRQPLDARGQQILGLMEQSAGRMNELVRNMLDFARTQLGGGIPVNRVSTHGLETPLAHIVDELQALYPTRVIVSTLSLDRPVTCDPDRIGQLFSNLLANALNHGEPGTPVRIEAEVTDGVFRLAVINNGQAIPPEAMENLFKPYVRGDRSRQGLGLGLYIAAGIAHAHGGTLVANSSPEETRFVLHMPSELPGSDD